MLTRQDLRALPLAQLEAIADAALRAGSLRYGLPTARARGLHPSMLAEIALMAPAATLTACLPPIQRRGGPTSSS